MSTDTTPTAERPAEATETDEQPDAPAATDETATGELDAAQADGEDQDRTDAPAADDEDHTDGDELPAGDTFPRKVVERLRKQNTTLRDRAKAAEAAVNALQQKAADKQIKDAGLRPAAVWAVAELGDVLADDGTVDSAKLSAAMSTAKEQLGVAPPRRPAPRHGPSHLRSGSGVSPSKPPGFEAAFAPQPK